MNLADNPRSRCSTLLRETISQNSSIAFLVHKNTRWLAILARFSEKCAEIPSWVLPQKIFALVLDPSSSRGSCSDHFPLGRYHLKNVCIGATWESTFSKFVEKKCIRIDKILIDLLPLPVCEDEGGASLSTSSRLCCVHVRCFCRVNLIYVPGKLNRV